MDAGSASSGVTSQMMSHTPGMPQVLCPHTHPITGGRVPPPPTDSARFGMLVGVLGLTIIIGLAGWVLVQTGNLMGALFAILFVVALAFVVRLKR